MSVSNNVDPDGPLFEWFIKNYHRGNGKGTKNNSRRAQKHFEEFLERKNITPYEVDRDLAYEFMSEIAKEYSPTYQKTIVGEVDRFYNYCIKRNVKGIDGNPISIVADENSPLDVAKRRDPHIISVEEMSEYIKSWDHPLYLGCVTTLAKTTRRAGEVLNLDLYDLNIDHPACDWEVHPEIRHSPDYIHFPHEPSEGEEFRGEMRDRGNKSVERRKCPIDAELKQVLIWWLLIRQGAKEPYSPLFKSFSGERLSYGTLAKKIQEKSENLGYYYGKHDPDNVTCHYFRHWSTTTLRDRSTKDSGLVDYIRGDSGNDTKDTYTHWSPAKEKEYLEIVPKFFD